MPNPWLDIPADDYHGHMASPEVGQEAVLARLLGEALETVRPRSLLLLGCGAGNGLERVDPAVTSRVTGIDINSDYLRRLAERFPAPGFALELRADDLATSVLEREAYDLIHGGLVFEYLDWPPLLPRLAAALRLGGTLSLVLQLPAEDLPAVTQTPFTSLRQLETIFHFVAPGQLVAEAAAAGLPLGYRQIEPLPSGKRFAVLRFSKYAR